MLMNKTNLCTYPTAIATIQRYELFIKLIKYCNITAAINKNSRVKSTLSSCKYENKIIVLQRNLFQQKIKQCALIQQQTLCIL